MRNLFTLTICLFTVVTAAFGQGSESFTNVPATGASYVPVSWTGDNALSWSAANGRTDQVLTGTAMTIRDNGGNVICNNIPGGCGTLTFNYARAFTSGSPSVSVFINGIQVGGAFSSTSSVSQLATVNANVAGTFNLEIRQTVAGTAHRMILDNISWTASGAACTPPTTQSTAVAISNTTASSFDINWTAGSGSNSLVVVKQAGAVTGAPTSGTAYTASTTFGSGQTIAGGEYVVYNGVGNTVSVTGLTSGTTYHVSVFSFNNADNCYNTTSPATANATTSCTQPTVQVSTITVTPGGTTASISWSGGNGNSSLVRLNAASSFTAPADGTTYTANTVYGGGEQTVYSGTGSSVNVSGLTVSTIYYVTVYTFNSCASTPDYLATGNTVQNFTTTSGGSGEPAGYYSAAIGLTCAALKTALSTIITTGMVPKTYGDLWTQYLVSDVKPREVGPGTSPNVIWDIYSENPTGTDPYNFTPGPAASGGQQDGGGAAGSEGILYNREHSVPQSWFGASAASGSIGPESDYFHIFPTDKVVNANRSNFIYGTVSSPTITSANGAKLGPNTFSGLSGTAFEPINAFKGDLARGFLYFVTRYQSNMAAWQTLSTEGDKAFDGTTWPSVEISYLQMMLQWHNADPVSQKEIDRNNAGYIFQGNRNPFIDHPEYAGQVWSGSCGLILPIDLTIFTAKYASNSVLLNWKIERADGFSHFEIERSSDGGRTWQKASSVLWHSGVNDYSFTDNVASFDGTIFYRLKMIDMNMVYKYSHIISVKLPGLEGVSLLYPNPAKDVLTIAFRKSTSTTLVASIFDISGRNVSTARLLPGLSVYPLNVSPLSNGKYILKIQDGDRATYSHFIIQQ
jgi:endonuclease I